MVVIEWSEFERDPHAVATLADREDVHLRRQGEPELLLTRTERVERATEGAFIAARAVRAVLSHLSAESAIELLVEEFPWPRLMPDDARAAFAKEFELRLRTSADLGEWSTLNQFLTEWKDTAGTMAVSAEHPKETE